MVKKTRFELTAAFPPQFEFFCIDSYMQLEADLEVGVGSSDKVRKGCEKGAKGGKSLLSVRIPLGLISFFTHFPATFWLAPRSFS